MTYREVFTAARGRQKEAWSRDAVFAALAHQSFTGERIDPIKLIPVEFRPDVREIPKTEAQKKHDTRCALTLIGQALGVGR